MLCTMPEQELEQNKEWNNCICFQTGREFNNKITNLNGPTAKNAMQA